MSDNTTTDNVEGLETEAQQPGEVVQWLDPSTLLLDRNIRSETTSDKSLTASVREVGVLQPIVAVASHDGIRVRYGHRRTLAALATDQPLVPVIVREDDGDEKGRIVTQWHENAFRAGISEADQVQAVDQLALLGVSATQIAKRLQVSREAVKTARVIAGNETAKTAMDAYPAMTLAQAGVLAEFAEAGDTETVEALIALAERDPLRFDHAAARARSEAATRARQEEARQVIVATGVTVLPGRPGRADEVTPLADLRDSDGQPIRLADHAGCPGHVAWLATTQELCTEAEAATVRLDSIEDDLDDVEDEDPADYDGEDEAQERAWRVRYAAAYGCLEALAHGHQIHSWGYNPASSTAAAECTPEEQAAAKQAGKDERKRVVTNNREWTAAEEVRRQWLRTYLTRKTPPKGTTAYLARELAFTRHALTAAGDTGHVLACDMLGVTPKAGHYNSKPTGLLELIASSSEGRTQVISLALTLCAYEASTTRENWRTPHSGTQAYLTHLASLGYPLSDVERLAAGQEATAGTEDQ